MLTELQKRKLTKLFSMYDECCDGFLVKKDFDNITKKLAGIRRWGMRSPRYLALMNQLSHDWKGLTEIADTDRDHKVSLDEWLHYYDLVLSDPKKYDQRVKELMEMVFDVFQHDGEGGITQQNWERLLSVYNVCPIYADIVFPTLDTSQSGIINREQMQQLIHDFFYSDEPDTPANLMFGPY